MRISRIWGVTVLGLLVMTPIAMSGRGGAVRGGMRGAVVGEMVGGSEGASKGAKIGVVTGATRSAIDRESTARTTYQATEEYKTAPRSDFNEAPPDVLVTTASATTKPTGEAVIRKDGKPLIGITFPADWKQKTGDNYIAAVSGDGQAYSVFAILDGVADRKAAIKKVQAGLEKHLKGIKYDEQAESKTGTVVVTGTGTGKKGVEVVFAAGVFDAAKGQLVGAAFFVDSKIDDQYKETVRGICQTLRRAEDFAKD